MSGSFARRKLLGILSGTWLAQAVYAVVKLGVPDLLAAGPLPARELAERTGADPLALYRLLRALALNGLLEQTVPGTFALNAASEPLRSDVPGSVRYNALMQGEEVYGAFAEIMYSLRSGRPAFEKVHGRGFYEYLDANPEAARIFYESMGDQPVPEGVEARDWTGVSTVVDVGGGNGALLAAVLADRPDLRGVLLERPEALDSARERLGAAGVADRVELTGGDFFTAVPGGGDVYVLARVLHNWADDAAVRILLRVREAMGTAARLLVAEEFMPAAGAPGAGARAMVDLLMLVTQEGHDRTAAEYGDLLAAAGFAVVSAGSDVLEARPA
jgi:O-methyltransferase/methyltransferase family protein